MISEQFNAVSSINNMAFNLFINRIYFMLQYLSGHFNGQNNFFLVLCDAYCVAGLGSSLSSTYTTPPPLYERFSSYFRFVQFSH